MFEKLARIGNFIRNLNNPVKSDMIAYNKLLEEINNISFEHLHDCELKAKSAKLKSLALRGISADELLVEAFALVREASRRVLGIYPYDTQVIAGIALHNSKIVEMQTGEGKTLAAVMPVYLNALTGKGVHVLTFNDYLAYRDASWMGPIYEFLGLTIGHIREGMNIEERQSAYSADITYVTAKEAGFDYLRDSLCTDKDKLTHRSFNYVIVDEADSIFIDEARIPLVIAGNLPEEEESPLNLARIIRKLSRGIDYELDQYERNISLTDAGLQRVERILGCGNLYDSQNLELLTRLNCALHAEVLLNRDIDYIVRNGRLELIDAFTGRIADKRHWPDNLQAAVEAKEGLNFGNKGMILGSIPLQYFLSLYPRISGMTGTAQTSMEEFKDFYYLDVIAIPTYKPCIRKDHPDMIFTHKEAKNKKLISEIKRINKTGQPILIGTSSVEESEQLSADLMKEGVMCRVLNAKNDEIEAEIIAKAGEYGAVTVSTNMAGRGVDIKLGGEAEQEHDRVAALGGLYVIGTSRHESRRIDNQLRGRAGRQGDPGESRFFISFEDELIKKYDATRLIPEQNYPRRQNEPIEDPVVRREIARGQRFAEGYHYDIRKQLWNYSFIIEQQRRSIYRKRQGILLDTEPLTLLSTKSGERYYSLCKEFGEAVMTKVEKQLTLYYISKGWAEYMDYIAYIREGIHLVVIGGKDPLEEFHRLAMNAFDEMVRKIDDEVLNTFSKIEIKADGIDMDKEGLKGPSSTWTYLINDSPEQFSRLPFITKMFKLQ